MTRACLNDCIDSLFIDSERASKAKATRRMNQILFHVEAAVINGNMDRALELVDRYGVPDKAYAKILKKHGM